MQATLTLRPGRVAGIVGVQGSGHGDLLHAVAGLRDYTGAVIVGGRTLSPGSVASARRAGVRLVPGDRRRAAIAAHLSLSDNVALSSTTASRFGFRRRRAERASTAGYVAAMDVRPGSTTAKAGSLSGGNQQKIAIANALESQPSVLLLEEPTQGVDVMGKVEIRTLVRALARSGRCVAIATSEFEDLPDYVDDIYVMRLGRLHGPVPPEQATYEQLLHAALP
jgi:ABC-type sugar transport system ATPase subunit